MKRKTFFLSFSSPWVLMSFDNKYWFYHQIQEGNESTRKCQREFFDNQKEEEKKIRQWNAESVWPDAGPTWPGLDDRWPQGWKKCRPNFLFPKEKERWRTRVAKAGGQGCVLRCSFFLLVLVGFLFCCCFLLSRREKIPHSFSSLSLGLFPFIVFFFFFFSPFSSDSYQFETVTNNWEVIDPLRVSGNRSEEDLAFSSFWLMPITPTAHTHTILFFIIGFLFLSFLLPTSLSMSYV